MSSTSHPIRPKRNKTNDPALDPAVVEQRPVDPSPVYRPALFADYRDLSKLRYDYPLVLARENDGAVVHPLSTVINRILREIAPRGPEGERVRCHVLRLEEAVRGIASRDGKQRLLEAWERGADALVAAAEEEERDSLKESLQQARKALATHGEIIDCDANATVDVVTHLWRGAETRKAGAVLSRIDRLIQRLEDMLEADTASSPEALSAPSLQRTMGGAFVEAFDFSALGRAIQAIPNRSPLPEARKKRISDAIAVLKSQRLFQHGEFSFDAFVFDSPDRAVRAHEKRLDEIAAVMRAIGVAELELANRYRESVHDTVSESFDRRSLKPGDIAQFPSSLVLLRDVNDSAVIGRALEAVASGLPMKIVVIVDDLSEASPLAGQIADMAIGLNEGFVMQTTASQLGRSAGYMAHGLASPGPALFSIYSGSGRNTASIPPYLAAAAANESRAVPAYCFDPGAGSDWADRFELAPNPQSSRAWPVHPFVCEDAEHRRIAESVAFTWVDFAGCDRRFDDRFKSLAPDAWTDDMLPLADYMELPAEERAGKRPFIIAVDEHNRLVRRLPDEALIAAAARCGRRWRSLQELGGIDNSHAARLLEQERARWNKERDAELQDRRAQAPAQARTEGESSAAPSSANGVHDATVADTGTGPEGPKSDQPYIETLRCTTCEECIKINDRVFAYNENKQAYIVDPTAGTYSDLVRAAENCQVAIIHPGEPHDPDEPGLDDLLKRAEPFR